jgi:hypothetical protein
VKRLRTPQFFGLTEEQREFRFETAAQTAANCYGCDARKLALLVPSQMSPDCFCGERKTPARQNSIPRSAGSAQKGFASLRWETGSAKGRATSRPLHFISRAGARTYRKPFHGVDQIELGQPHRDLLAGPL